MGEVIQLQGDQRKDVQEFLVDKKEGLELDAKTIKVCAFLSIMFCEVFLPLISLGPWVLNFTTHPCPSDPFQWAHRSSFDKNALFTSSLLMRYEPRTWVREGAFFDTL